MYYKGTKNQCQYYNRKVYNGTQSMKADPFTTSYASIQEVEGQCYILAHKDFDSKMQSVDSLPIVLDNNVEL